MPAGKKNKMNRIVILSFAVIAVVLAIFAVLISVPQKQVPCQPNDGLCPSQCSAETDSDCPRTRTANLGSVKHCLNDADCIAVKPICGNLDCGFNDGQCKSNKYCATAIGKDYSAAWTGAIVKCLDPVVANCESLTNYKVACASGTCITLGRAST